MPSVPTVFRYSILACLPLGSRWSSMRLEYLSNHSGSACSPTHSGAAAAEAFKAARIVSAASSSRLRTRKAPSTWVESVRCLPRAFR
jgi:hypothetical protein